MLYKVKLKMNGLGFPKFSHLYYITIGADMKHLPERSILPGGKDKEVVFLSKNNAYGGD